MTQGIPDFNHQELGDIIVKAMSKKPSQRWKNAKDFANELKKFLGDYLAESDTQIYHLEENLEKSISDFRLRIEKLAWVEETLLEVHRLLGT